jgi:hypothetical protein
MHPFLFLCFQPTIDFILSLPVPLQADNALRADARVMEDTRRQVETVACLQYQLLSQLWQSKRDAPLHDIDDLVVGMGMC